MSVEKVAAITRCIDCPNLETYIDPISQMRMGRMRYSQEIPVRGICRRMGIGFGSIKAAETNGCTFAFMDIKEVLE